MKFFDNLIKQLIHGTVGRLSLQISDLYRYPQYPIELFDEDGNVIFEGYSGKHWVKREYNHDSQLLYEEWSDGKWEKYDYDKFGREVLFEDKSGFWEKRTYRGDLLIQIKDSRGNIEKPMQFVEQGGKEYGSSYEDCISDIQKFVSGHEDMLDVKGSAGFYELLAHLTKELG